jgi:hypothetical protein
MHHTTTYSRLTMNRIDSSNLFSSLTMPLLFLMIFLLNVPHVDAQKDTLTDLEADYPPKYRLSLESNITNLSGTVNSDYLGALIGLRSFPENGSSGISAADKHLLLSDMGIKLDWRKSDSQPDRLGFEGIELSFRQWGSLHADDDFLRLLLDGNSRFADDTARLDASSLAWQQYASIGVNYSFRKLIGDYQWQVSIVPGLLIGLSDQRFSTANSWLYTAEYGQSIDLQADYSYSSNQGRPGGVGLGISAKFQLMVKNKWVAQFNLKDLGYIFWNDQSEQVNNQTFIHFEGVELPNLTDLNGLNPDSTIESEIVNPLYSEVLDHGSYQSHTLPSVSLQILRLINDSDMSLSLTSKQYLHHALANLTHLGFEFPISKRMAGDAQVGLVAFQRPYVGASLMYKTSNSFKIYLRASDLTSLVAPDKAYLQALTFSINYYW